MKKKIDYNYSWFSLQPKSDYIILYLMDINVLSLMIHIFWDYQMDDHSNLFLGYARFVLKPKYLNILIY